MLPTIISPERFNANIGDTAVLNCNASSHPAVKFEWEFFKSFQPIKLKPLDVFEKYSVRATTSKQMPGNIIISSSSLVIRNVQRDDWRFYVCYVKSEIGDDQKDIEVLGYCKHYYVPILVEFIITSNLKTSIEKRMQHLIWKVFNPDLTHA